MYCTRKVNDDYTWVGADGRRLAMFEGVFDVPAGISFNSYLLRDEKTVLFDTTDAAVRRTFRENLLHALEGRSLDCVVVHHMEPDHTAELEELVLRFPEVQIYCSAMAKTMMTQFFGPGLQERIHVVKEGDTLCTGRHTLRFIAAPMVHWPEVLMTYDETDRLLLTADAFGCFGALNGRLFADEVDFDRDYLDEARRYYTNIVGKYGSQVQAVLKKAAELDIAMLLPPSTALCGGRSWGISCTSTTSGAATSRRSGGCSSPMPPCMATRRTPPTFWPADCRSGA